MSEAPGALDLLRLCASLAAVIGLVFLAARLLRRNGARGSVRQLAIEERLGIARGIQLLVVTARGRRLLLGVAEKNVSLLTDLDDDDDTDGAAATGQDAVAPSLREAAGAETSAAFGQRFARHFRDQLAARLTAGRRGGGAS